MVLSISWIQRLLLVGATAWMLNDAPLVGQDSDPPATAEPVGKNVTPEKAAFLAQRMPLFRWRMSLDGIEFLRVEAIGISLKEPVSDNDGIVCAISQKLLDTKLPEPLKVWEEHIRGTILAPSATPRPMQSHSMGNSELVSTFQTKTPHFWNIVGSKDGVVFVSVPNVFGFYKSSSSLGVPKYFLGTNKQSEVRSFDSAELLLEECHGGVAMDELGNIALVTKYQDEVKIYDRDALSALYSSVHRESKAHSENEYALKKIASMQRVRDDLRWELDQLVNSHEKTVEDEKIAIAEASLSREKAMLQFDAIKNRLASAKAELQHDEEILSTLDQRVTSAKRNYNNGTMSNDEVSKIELEFKMQRKEIQVAQSKIQQLETELKTADIQIQVFHLESARLNLKQERQSKPTQENIAKTRMRLAETEKELTSLLGKLSGAATPQQDNTPHPLSGKSREDVYRLLEEQFNAERESVAKELQAMKDRIEKLERAEKDKESNKEGILKKRLEAILGTNP